MPRRKKSVKVFIDSSVLFAAILSPTGGSFRIFQEASLRGLLLFVTPYVLAEVENAFQRKYPHLIAYFRSFMASFSLSVISNPSDKFTEKFLNLLPIEDTPILAGAMKAKVTFLITLDKKHFLNTLRDEQLPFEILTPGEFIKKYF